MAHLNLDLKLEDITVDPKYTFIKLRGENIRVSVTEFYNFLRHPLLRDITSAITAKQIVEGLESWEESYYLLKSKEYKTFSFNFMGVSITVYSEEE